MRIKILILLILILAFNIALNAKNHSIKAIKGITDLRELSYDENFSVTLSGDWEFYWKKILRPNDFKQKSIKPLYFGKVPSYWTDYSSDLVKTEKFGYATYRLTILLPKGFKNSLGFDLPVFDSSYDIYIDNKYIGGNGITGTSEEESVPEYLRSFYRVIPTSDSLTIIINVSNYHHRRGGFWLPIKFGTFSEIQRKMTNSWAADWSVISLLGGFSLFFFLFFLFARKEKVMGSFSITTFGLALRPLFTSHYLIHNLISMSWIWIVRFEYLILYLIITGAAWFALNIYPTKFFRKIVWILTILFSLISLITFFLPVKLFSYAIIVYYPTILLVLGYLLFNSLKGALKRNRIDLVYFLAFCVLFFSGLHEILVSLGKDVGSSGYTFQYIIVVFVFIQASLLLYKWVRALMDKDRLQNELEFMNRNLELIVDKRTREIKKRNAEIEKQNNKIAIQNKQLSDTIQLKNRIFSVIAHDLRSPVVNILYMLNLLKEKEYKEKYDTFADSSINYAQQVISLLENMLVWGRGQEDKIHFSPEKRDLADIILTNLSIFKETADKKAIAVNFTQVGSSITYIDKDLLDIIIRNLLSNAVKYTHRGGRISILLKDKTMNGDGIMLKICDNGMGIPESKQKFLFTSDEVQSTAGTEDEKGTGLGLKLCYEFVKLHNGNITVESKEGEGTCFVITLPQ